MSGLYDWYYDLMYKRADPRTDNWPLTHGPIPVLSIVTAYVYFSTNLGPKLMKDRKPFQLRNILIVYNFIQVILSIYLVYEASAAGWLTGYSFTCQPVDYSNSPKAMRMARGVYLYFVCKIVELLDTVFFVLRKKQRQISFLHVYHHAMMPICAWIGVRWVAGGHPTLLGTINSFIHILMYAYYMLSAFGPEVQKYLWWKKYLTSLQLIQFTIILWHNVQIFFTDCEFPRPLAFLLCVNAGLFIYLFGSFYINNYLKKNKSKNQQKLKSEAGNEKSKYQNGNSNGHVNGVIRSEKHDVTKEISNGYSKGKVE